LIENNLLVHELQLGEKLSQSVHHERRSDFSLMLAMLTQDVRDHSQFLLPENQQTSPQTTDASLRKTFELPQPAPLAVSDVSDLSGFNQAELVESGQLSQIHLLNALHPAPLAFRDDKQHIAHDVLDNTSVHCQQKHQHKDAEPAKLQRLDFNATGWLNAVKGSRLESDMTRQHHVA
jgi:hypothetical protein